MLFIVKIVLGYVRILGCNTDQFMVLQQLFRILRSADAHPAFSKPEIQDFVDIASLLQYGILPDNTDVRGAVFYISGHIRSLGKEKTKL